MTNLAHRPKHGRLRVTLAIPAILASALLAIAAEPLDVSKTLHGIEDRYNNIQTLQLSFAETYRIQGRARTEKGELFLHKPGKMRWQYTAPPGKLFVSDGKFIYSYTPPGNRAEQMKLQETDDMRAPLAFLLCRLEVKGQDNSVLRFTFENEKKDPAIQDAMFRFTPPPGAEYVDSSNQP